MGVSCLPEMPVLSLECGDISKLYRLLFKEENSSLSSGKSLAGPARLRAQLFAELTSSPVTSRRLPARVDRSESLGFR